MGYMPKLIEGKVKDTGLPIDGHILVLSIWDWDNYSSWHLTKWSDKADEAVMKTLHQEDELYCYMPLEEFEKLWKADKYDPSGIYSIPLDKVEVIETICEELND